MLRDTVLHYAVSGTDTERPHGAAAAAYAYETYLIRASDNGEGAYVIRGLDAQSASVESDHRLDAQQPENDAAR